MKLLRYLAGSSLVIGALALVIFLRLYQLGQLPRGINVDEASYGYDAYNLLKTGVDMWGHHDSSLESFGDYKPAGLSYTLVPLVKYFGLSTFITRLPSAVFGLLTLGVSFFLLRYLFSNLILAFLGSLILALSPWHFGLSRLFYEPNSGLFFIVCSIFLELKFIKNPGKIKYLILSSIFVALGGYYYSVLRYLGFGVLGISVIIAYFPSYLKIFKYGLLALFFWLLIASPYVGDMFGSRGLIRLKQESNLHQFGDTLVITENRQMCYIASGYNQRVAKLCYLLWNKPGEKLINTAKVYVQLLSPKYLFLNSYQKDVLPETSGAFLEIIIPFYLLGIYYLVVNLRKNKGYLYILISWLFVNIPVAMAGALNIHRNVIGLYFAYLICLYGLYYFQLLIIKVRPKIIKYSLIAITILGFVWSQSRFLANYFFVFTRMQPEIWQSDTPELMQWLGANNQGRSINFYDYDFAPLYYSFYNQLDPTYFQQYSTWSPKNEYGWTHVDSIGDSLHNQSNIWATICLHQDKSIATQLLVVTGAKAEWQSVVEKQFKNYTGIHVMHEIYDSKTLYGYLTINDPANLTFQCSLLIK